MRSWNRHNPMGILYALVASIKLKMVIIVSSASMLPEVSTDSIVFGTLPGISFCRYFTFLSYYKVVISGIRIPESKSDSSVSSDSMGSSGVQLSRASLYVCFAICFVVPFTLKMMFFPALLL